MKYKKEQGFYFVGTHCSPAQSQPTKPLYCLGGKQWGNEEQMGSCKWRFDTWCKGIREGGGGGVLIVPLSQCYTPILLLPQHQVCSSPPPLQQSPLTHPHLLVPGPDIAALLRRRLVNTRDTLQFNVSDSVCRGWKASGAERGPQTIRRISTHPSVHKLNRPSLNPFSGDFSLSWFFPLQHIYYTCRLYEKSTCWLKRSVFYLAENQ